MRRFIAVPYFVKYGLPLFAHVWNFNLQLYLLCMFLSCLIFCFYYSIKAVFVMKTCNYSNNWNYWTIVSVNIPCIWMQIWTFPLVGLSVHFQHVCCKWSAPTVIHFSKLFCKHSLAFSLSSLDDFFQNIAVGPSHQPATSFILPDDDTDWVFLYWDISGHSIQTFIFFRCS